MLLLSLTINNKLITARIGRADRRYVYIYIYICIYVLYVYNNKYVLCIVMYICMIL